MWTKAGMVTIVAFGTLAACNGGKSKGGMGTAKPPPPSARGTGSDEIANKGQRVEGKEVAHARWGAPLPGARPPSKKPPGGKSGGICERIVKRNRRCVDEIVDLMFQKYKGSRRMAKASVSLKKRMRKLMLKSEDKLLRGCRQKLTGGGSGIIKAKACLGKTGCTAYARCIMRMAGESKKNVPSP